MSIMTKGTKPTPTGMQGPFQRPLNYESFYLLPQAVNGRPGMKCDPSGEEIIPRSRSNSRRNISSRHRRQLSATAKPFVPSSPRHSSPYERKGASSMFMPSYSTSPYSSRNTSPYTSSIANPPTPSLDLRIAFDFALDFASVNVPRPNPAEWPCRFVRRDGHLEPKG
eukprot:CAMPEP_0167814542 /NCGR_PEP_ID=MMETSP0112_2-20121227/2482_1 /TAXON_ID=91324 /ORGANISM="Lotharella globosa, Strain CCCM811" /LENGTH=166 /DNA_ID=CAMNT_0007713777 /DNA_START=44 /DNA_END=543 /DNA_ORIENTATION=+